MPQEVARTSEVASIGRTAFGAIVDTDDPAHRKSVVEKGRHGRRRPVDDPPA
jgi:hypothetical protein